MADRNINRRINIYVNGKEVENSATGIKRAMKQVENQINRLDASAADYDDRLAALSATYRQLEGQHNAFKNVLKETPGILGKIKNALGPVATGMLTAFSVQGLIEGFVGQLGKAWQVVVEFDQKQADLAAILGKSKAGIVALTADAIKYGATTSYNASQVSELQTELARLGKTEKEIRAMTKSVLESATALETDLAPAAELVGGQLNSYMENAREAQRYSDIMANSVNISATSYEYLAGSLPKVSAVAYQSDVSFEKLSATMGTLADQNIAAETAGTGFRNILLAAAAAGKPYEEMLKDVNSATDKTKKATELFGKENATVAVILATSTEKIDLNTKALERSGGAAEKLAKEKMNSIKGAISNFESAWEGFILSLEKGDGFIAKTMQGFVELGTAIISSVTPMRQLSDEIRDQQVELNTLVSRITSTNISEEERKRLIIELKEQYPDFLKNINSETVSNEQLKKELIKVNAQYRDRIMLQKQVEKRDDAKKSFEGITGTVEKTRLELAEMLQEIAVDNKIDFTVDYGNIERSAEQLKKILKDKGLGKGWLGGGMIGSDLTQIDRALRNIKMFQEAADQTGVEYKKQEDILKGVQKATGLLTEEEKEKAAALAEEVAMMKELREEAKKFGMKNADSAADDEVKKWIAAYKEKLKYSGESDDEKKEREKKEKKAEQERKRRKKEEEDLAKQLLESQRSAEDARLDILADGFEKERKMVNEEFARKIEDLQRQKVKQSEITALRGKIEVAKKNNNPEELRHYQKLLDDKLALNESYNERIDLLENQRMLKVAALQEKHLKLEVQRTEEANQAELNNLRAKQAYELAEFTSYQKAKAILADYLSSEELRKITTLEDAKKKIKELHMKEDFRMQEKHLMDLIAQWNVILTQEKFSGIEIFTPQQRQEILNYLNQVSLKLAEIKAGGAAVDQPAVDTTGQQAYNGLDIFGTSVEEWDKMFANLDTFKGKMDAISAVSQGMQQAFGTFFDFLDARDQRSLQKYERNSNRRKRELADQLEKGYISQEAYNARVEKLELELAKKKAQIEYKEAKRRKALAIMQAIISTAQGVATALQGPPPASYIFAGITAAMGALQIATIASEPLPAKDGFKVGGYTGDGNPSHEAGPVHKREYVIPEGVLFDNDPAMPAIVKYLENKRRGRRNPGFKDGGATSNEMPKVPGVPVNDVSAGNEDRLINALNRNTTILEKLEANGVEGYIVMDYPSAKKIRKKIRELEQLENTSRK